MDDAQHPTQVDLVRALESIDDAGIAFAQQLVEHQQQHHHEEPDVIDYTNTNADTQDGVATTTTPLADARDLEGWSREQLQAEIVKLRRLAAGAAISSLEQGPMNIESIANGHSDAVGDNDTAAVLAAALVRAGATISHDPTNSTAVQSMEPTLHALASIPSLALTPSTAESSAAASKKRGKKRKNAEASTSDDIEQARKIAPRRQDTGKRLEKERRTELSKVVRAKMRAALGIGLADPLPHPYNTLDPSFAAQIQDSEAPFIPDWHQMFNDETNVAWVARIGAEVQEEAAAGQYHRIPQADLDPEIINTTTRTAFQNLCKRYLSDNHPKSAERRERYTKKRRRWARKDLKQKKRARSIADPSLIDIHLPPTALHLDYMSSEYSSAGEEDDDPLDEGITPEMVTRRREKWNDMISARDAEERVNNAGKGGWAAGLGEKVLEVRTPRWRSEQLNEIYRRLDAVANEQADQRANSVTTTTTPRPTSTTTPTPTPASSAIRAGHVAPSHRRFTFVPDLMRKGKAPRDLGEGWMWASGVQGVWPSPSLPQSTSQSSVFDHEHEQGSGNEVPGGWDDGVDDMEIGEVERLGLVSALEGLP